MKELVLYINPTKAGHYCINTDTYNYLVRAMAKVKKLIMLNIDEIIDLAYEFNPNNMIRIKNLNRTLIDLTKIEIDSQDYTFDSEIKYVRKLVELIEETKLLREFVIKAIPEKITFKDVNDDGMIIEAVAYES